MNHMIRLRWLFRFFLVCLFCLAAFYEPVSAETKENHAFSFQSSINFDQFVKYNRFANVSVRIKCKTGNFKGYVQAILNEEGTQNNPMYQAELSIKNGIVKKVNLVIPISYNLKSITFQIVDKKGNVKLKEQKQLVIEKDPSIFFLGIIGQSDEYFYRVQGKAFRPIPIDYDEIPSELEGFNSLDGMYIGKNTIYDQPLSVLEKVREWNQLGGTVLLESSSEVLVNYMGVNRKLKSTVKDQKGTELYHVFQNGRGILIEWVYYEDMAQIQINQTQYMSELLYNLKSHYSDDSQDELFKNTYLKDNGEEALVRSLETVDKKYLPKPMLYVLAIIIYAFVAGPLLYFIVKKLRKNMYYYIGVMIASGCFVIIFMFLGWNTSIDKFIVNSVTIYNYDDWIDNVKEQTYFGIIMPKNHSELFYIKKKADISLKNESPEPMIFTKGTNGKSAYDVSITKSEKDTSIEIVKPLYMKPYVFECNSWTESSRKIASSITYNGLYVTGYLENHLGYDLENAFFLSNYQITPIGSFDNGTHFTLSYRYGNFSYSKLYQKPEELIKEQLVKFNKKGVYDPDTYQKVAALQYCLKNQCLRYNNESYLIGFIRTGSTKNAIEDACESKELKMIVYRIRGVKKRFGNASIVTDISKYEEVRSGAMDPVTRRMDDYYLVVDYYIPSEMKIEALRYNKVVNSGNQYSGTISIYNNKTKEYDIIYEGNEDMYVKELKEKHYIGQENKISLRYMLPVRESTYENNIIPVISAVWR